jgi:hypothetical protein
MVVILIRRFVRTDKEDEFLTNYLAQKPLENPEFLGETLTRVSDATGMPAGLRSFALNGSSCVTNLNIAQWQSWEAFAAHFAQQLTTGDFDPEIETAPRQRAVLDVIPSEAN